MKVEATAAAIEAVRAVRAGGRESLVMVLSSGCCDSTAPFLYDNYLPEPGSERVGEIDGVPILASGWIAELYAGDEGLVVDVDEGLSDSFSLETEYGRRFTLRTPARPDRR